MLSSSGLAAFVSTVLVSEPGIAPDGSEPVGWLAGGFTLVFCIAGVLLMWSFVRTSRRANAMWAERDAAEESAAAENGASAPETPSAS